uniref:Uncharacterized protein n=1 Tax=Eutreptiella gymnastica TaxID=73025 RepID=A0A7S4FDC0_9EUGL
MMLAAEEKKFLCTATLYFKEAKVGKVNLYHCSKPNINPYRKNAPAPKGLPKEVHLAYQMLQKHVDATCGKVPLLVEPKNFQVWKALDKLEARLSGSTHTTSKVAVASLPGDEKAAIVLPVPIGAALPVYKGFQVFVGYYIPKLNVNKRVSAISAPAKGDDRALTVFKEDREEKREERRDRDYAEKSQDWSSGRRSTSHSKGDNNGQFVSSATASGSYGAGSGSAMSRNTPPLSRGLTGEKRKMSADDSPRHKRHKSRRDRER